MTKLDTKTVKHILVILVNNINDWLNSASHVITHWNAYVVNYPTQQVSHYLRLAFEDTSIMISINEDDSFPNIYVPSYKKVEHDLFHFFSSYLDGKLFTGGSDKENHAEAKKLVKKAKAIIASDTKAISNAN